MTNNEAFFVLQILSDMKVCSPGSISNVTTGKVIEIICSLHEAIEKARRRVSLVQEQLIHEGTLSIQEMTDEQKTELSKAMEPQIKIIGEKDAELSFEKLTKDEFYSLLSANSATGGQASFLLKLIVSD